MFASEQLGAITKKYTKTVAFRTVSTTMGKMKSASRIIINQGGWDDHEGLLGSLRLFAQCILLSAGMVAHTQTEDERPWTGRHPQTGRIIYVELEFSWAEKMEQSWTEFSTAIEKAAITDATDEVHAAANSSSARPATEAHTVQVQKAAPAAGVKAAPAAGVKAAPAVPPAAAQTQQAEKGDAGGPAGGPAAAKAQQVEKVGADAGVGKKDEPKEKEKEKEKDPLAKKWLKASLGVIGSLPGGYPIFFC